MKITVSLKEETVLELLKVADSKGVSFDQLVNQLLKEKLIQLNRLKGYAVRPPTIPIEHSDMANVLMGRIKNLPMGEVFTVRELLADKWDELQSPRSFGWVVKKLLDNNSEVETIKKSGCKKYRRC